MFLKLAWVSALVISTLVLGSVTALAFIDPGARDGAGAPVPALYGP